mmetsp:Transcript_22820/g.45145  ORF Transcript_22820/g.45145 Transcript_22820/m.45145 type:complete len:578 (+) Transcript_22820:1530-3263(+)
MPLCLFFPNLLNMMGQLMSQTDDKMLDLRAEATECMGAMAAAVGKQHFSNCIEEIMKLVFEGFKLDYYRLREASYNFFACIAVMLEADFERYMLPVMTHLIATCASEGGLNVKANGAFDNYDVYDQDDEEDIDDEDENLGRFSVSIRSGAIEEKIQALACIGTLCTSVGPPAVPYLTKIAPELVQNAIFPHPAIRQATMQTVQNVISLVHKACPPPQEPKAGVVVPLHPDVQALLFGDEGLLMNIIIEELMDEDDKTAVAFACDALFEILKKFGLAALQPVSDDVCKAILMLVKEESPCQQNYDDGDPEAADHDEILIDSVTDIIGVMAQISGASFEPVFSQMFVPICKFVQPHRAESDRSMAVGCFAEVFEAMGAVSEKFLDQALPIVFTGLQDSSVQVRRNSAFCIGVLAEVIGPKLFSMHPKMLELLLPNLRVPDGLKKKKEIDGYVATKENAASAICKMLAVNSGGLPVQQLVPEVLNSCPLTNDLTECKSVYGTIMFLFQSQTQMMANHLPQIINIFAQALYNGDVDETVRMEVAAFCKSLSQPYGTQIQQVLQQLPEELRQAFVKSIEALQ